MKTDDLADLLNAPNGSSPPLVLYAFLLIIQTILHPILVIRFYFIVVAFRQLVQRLVVGALSYVLLKLFQETLLVMRPVSLGYHLVVAGL